MNNFCLPCLFVVEYLVTKFLNLYFPALKSAFGKKEEERKSNPPTLLELYCRERLEVNNRRNQKPRRMRG